MPLLRKSNRYRSYRPLHTFQRGTVDRGFTCSSMLQETHQGRNR